MVQSTVQNRLLKCLSPADFDLLAPDLEYVTFSLRDQMESPGKAVESAFFVEDGIASIVAKSPEGEIEIGLVGFDGMTGTSLVLGGTSTPLSVFIQLAVSGHRIAAGKLLAATTQSPSLQRIFLLYIQTLIIQAATTGLINGQAGARTRLARWLLMVHDRTSGHDLFLTHEFMAVMPGHAPSLGHRNPAFRRRRGPYPFYPWQGYHYQSRGFDGRGKRILRGCRA